MMQTNQSTASRNSDVLEEDDDATEISRSFSSGWIVGGPIQHSAFTFEINKSPGTSVQGLEENSVISTEINSPEHNIDNLWDELFRISSLPPLRENTSTLHALQEWEGYVEEVGEIDFVARLIDLTDKSKYEAEAVIPLDEISDDDAAKVSAGSIFRWVIGYEHNSAGTKRRVSQIIFRDLPVITGSDLIEGKEWANKVNQLFE